MIRSCYHLPEPDSAQLREWATRMDVPISELVRRAVHAYLQTLSQQHAPLAHQGAR